MSVSFGCPLGVPPDFNPAAPYGLTRLADSIFCRVPIAYVSNPVDFLMDPVELLMDPVNLLMGDFYEILAKMPFLFYIFKSFL